ncbi:MAG: hypothetical protein AAFQ17_01350, partial [Pseudomonadota bacterium]
MVVFMLYSILPQAISPDCRADAEPQAHLSAPRQSSDQARRASIACLMYRLDCSGRTKQEKRTRRARGDLTDPPGRRRTPADCKENYLLVNTISKQQKSPQDGREGFLACKWGSALLDPAVDVHVHLRERDAD